MSRYPKNKFLHVLAIVIGSLALLVQNGIAEDAAFSTIDEDRLQAKKLTSFAELFRDKTDQTYRGVLFGNILSIDPKFRFIYIKTKERDLPRIFVYIDKKTIFTKSDVGLRKRVRPSVAIEGARIVARVFVRQGVVVADEVFLVQEEFEAPSRYEKKKFAVRRAPADAAEKKAEGGGGH